MLVAMISALRGSCQMCGSPSGSSALPARRATPVLASTTVPDGEALETVSANHFSRPTPFSTMTSARAMASRSAGEGS